MEHILPEISDRAFRWITYSVILVALLSICLHIFECAGVTSVWDDSYMTFRVAHNVLAHGVIAWNGTTPSFGITSTLQVIITVVIAMFSSNPTAVVTISSLIGTVLFLISIPLLVASVIPASERIARYLSIAASFTIIALAVHGFSLIAVGGMDTMLALAFVSLYLIVILRGARSLGTLSRPRLLWIGLLGASTYLVRPDLLLFPFLITLSLALWSRAARERTNAWIILGVTVSALVLLLIGFWVYFGTALPLSFIVKGIGHLYGPVTLSRIKFQPVLQFLTYVDTYRVLFIAPIILVLFGWRRIFVRGEHAIVIGMLASAGAFPLYYLFFVVQMVGYLGRFYYPTLPILLALTSLLILLAFRKFFRPDARSAQLFTAGTAGIMLLVLLYNPLMWGVQQLGYALVSGDLIDKVAWQQNMIAQYREGTNGETRWPCLDVWAALPNDASVATTEIGMPSVIAPDKYLQDISGLQSNDITLARMPFDQAIIYRKIDIVYLPYEQYYPELRTEILSSPAFQQQYKFYYRGDPDQLDVAVRNDSPYAATLEKCLAAVIPPGGAENPPVTQKYYLSLPYPLSGS